MSRRFFAGLIAFAIVYPGLAVFADQPARDRITVYIETDPIPLALGGWSAHGGVSLPSWDRTELGISVVHGIRLPSALVESDPENRGLGFDVTVVRGAGAWFRYRFSPDSDGAFLGAQLFTQELELRRSGASGVVDRTNLGMAVVQVGYRWFPFSDDRGLYVAPWAGAGVQFVVPATFEPRRVTAETNVAGERYDISPFVVFATVHIGVSF